MIKPLSDLHVSSYERKFGSWRKALENFVEYINSDEENKIDETENNIELKSEISIELIEAKNEKKLKIKRTSRTINWRLRFIIMKDDNFKCRFCGRSPATDQSIILHVDHIKPWSNGGETIRDNLQTLCSVCNIGKSNIE